jgi:hypothetical protein
LSRGGSGGGNCDDEDRMDVDCNDADGDDINRDNRNGRPP